jgi:hypothetical protein
MFIRNLAKQIPNKVRSEILLTPEDIIENAVPSAGNDNMQKLMKIWHAFIEPHKEPVTCPICLDGIKTNFKQMKPYLIELENEYRKLQAL